MWGETLMSTQQSRGTLWESGVMGGEKPLTIGHYGKLGFWVGIIKLKTAHPKLPGFTPAPPPS